MPKRTKKSQASAAATCNGEYRANFLWPHEAGSVEEAGYEFGNGKTQEYQKFWWETLLERAKAQNSLDKVVVLLKSMRDRLAAHDGCSRFSVVDSKLINDVDAFIKKEVTPQVEQTRAGL